MGREQTAQREEERGSTQITEWQGGVTFANGDAEPSGSEETWVLVLALTLVCCVTLGETLLSLNLIPHLKK